MDKIEVKLLHYTPLEVLLKVIEQPYSKEGLTVKTADKIINTLKHESVAEHVSMNFFIKGVSRSELQEHMRHRISSSTVKSTRFTLDKIDGNIEDNFVIPCWEDLVLDHDEERSSNYLDDLIGFYNESVRLIKKYKELEFRNDYLKYFCVEGMRTQFVWSINLRSLKNFLKLRLDKKAHFEIRKVAWMLSESLDDTYIAKLI